MAMFPTPYGQGLFGMLQGGMRSRAPLGSGLYETPEEYQNAFGNPDTPHALGSGLFGQSPIPANIAQAPQAAQGAKPAGGFSGKFSALMNDPMFVMGLSLLGNARNPNAINDSLQNTMGLMGQQNAQKRADAAAQAQAERFAIEQANAQRRMQMDEKRYGLDEKRYGLDEQRLGIDQRGADLKEREANATIPLHEAQAGLYGAQAAHAQAQTGQIQQQSVLQQQIMQQMQGMLGGPQGAPAPQPGMMQQSMQDNGAAGRHGTPAWLLDRLAMTESSGNPKAINPQSGAQGAYQFMPTTVDMLKKQGHEFDPFDYQQSRDTADMYLQSLLKENGGDWNKTLAAYGGFKTKDPTPYIMKVTGGQPLPGPAQGAQGQGPAMPTMPQAVPPKDKGLQMMQLGAMAGLAGVKGTEGLTELGKAMMPQAVSAGGYLRDSQGNMTYVPDPAKERQLQIDTQRLNNENTRTRNDTVTTAQTAQKNETQRAEAQANALAEVRSAATGLDRLEQNASSLLTHPGLGMNAGWAGALGFNKIPNSDGKDAAVKLESLKSKLVVSVLADLKTASKNGASGFGQLSEKEGQRLETMIENLNAAQSEKQLRESLNSLVQFARTSKASFSDRYNTLYGKEGAPGVANTLGPQPFNPAQAAPAAAPAAQPGAPGSSADNPIPLRDLLKSRKPAEGRSANGREAWGRVKY